MAIQTDRDGRLIARSGDSFPRGESTERSIGDFPDDEDDYYSGTHYEHRREHRSDPSVTDEVIRDILTAGVVYEAPGDRDHRRFLIQKRRNDTWDGETRVVEWTLIVAENSTETSHDWALVTVYSNYHDVYGVTNRYLERYQQRNADGGGD